MTAPRVGYLTARYPAVSHTFIAREIAALRRRGVAVDTFAIRRSGEDALLTDADRRAFAETFAILPITARRLAGAHLRAARARPVQYLRTLARALRLSAGGWRANLWQLFYFAEAIVLADECRRRGIRHLHAHFANVASAVAMLAAHYAAPDGATWSFTMHGPTEFDDVTRFALADKIRSARFVACISDYCRSQLMKLVEPEQWDKLHIVRCGLDFSGADAVAPADHAAAGAAPPGDTGEAGDDGPLRILSIGRMVPDKGQTLLLDAVAALQRQGVAATLTLVGDGPGRPEIEAAVRRLQLEDRVTLTGALGQDVVRQQYRTAQVFCLPSFAEGLPVVLMEAMAHGLPVVATRIAGVAELVDDGESGRLVPAGRVDALTAALAELAARPDLRVSWGEAGRQRVERDYDVDGSAGRLATLFAGRTVASP